MEETKWPLERRVEVVWRDSSSHGTWKTVEEHQKQKGVGPIRSCGYLMTNDGDVIQIAQSMSAMTQHVSDIITIPKEAVISLRYLEHNGTDS